MLDDARLKAESAQIEQMLLDLQGQLEPGAWAQLEAVLGRLVRLYGTGLQRALEHGRSCAAEPARLDDKVAGDELLASLLVLHGLHPLTAEQRLERLFLGLPARLGVADGAVMLVWLGDGAVRVLSALGEDAEPMLRKLIENAAPEVSSIDIVEIAEIGARKAI
jgi:hypothetical protein